MKFVLLLSIFLFGHTSANSQVVDKASRIEQVRTVVGGLFNTKIKAEFLILTTDLYRYKGKVISQTEDAFSLKTGKRAVIKIFYKEVLVINGENIAASFIPNPDLRDFGEWEDILKIDYNHYLEAILEDGQKISGRLNEKTKDKFTLIGKPGDTKFTLPRDQIVSVYRVWGSYAGAKKSASNGLKNGKEVGAAIGLTPEGKAFAALLGSGIGAIIGTMMGANRKEPNLMRILIYSK